MDITAKLSRDEELNTNIIIKRDSLHTVTLIKKDISKPWNNHDCSDKALRKIIGRPNANIKRVQFIDYKGLADMLELYL